MLINQLTEARHRLEKIKTTLDALDRYTKEHFQAEEALMTFRHYENLDEHRKQHQAFEEWLQAVKMVYSFSTSPDFFADTVVSTPLLNIPGRHLVGHAAYLSPRVEPSAQTVPLPSGQDIARFMHLRCSTPAISTVPRVRRSGRFLMPKQRADSNLEVRFGNSLQLWSFVVDRTPRHGLQAPRGSWHLDYAR